MVNDNAYRVVLTSSATVEDNARKEIDDHLIKVGDGQKSTLNEHGERIIIEPGVLTERVKLAEVISNGVVHSAEYVRRAGQKNPGALPAPGSARDAAEGDAQRLAVQRTPQANVPLRPAVQAA